MTTPHKAPYFVEILNHDNTLLTRYRFEHLPITIGRAYTNDVIIDDPYIAPEHAIVESADGMQLSIRDLNTKNGLKINGQSKVLFNLTEENVQLGHTTIRMRHAATVIAAEQVSAKTPQLEGLPPALAGIAMLTLSTIASTWLSVTNSNSNVTNYITLLAIVLASTLIWAGCWAFANRVVSKTGQTRFGRHLFIVACAAIVMDAWEILSNVVGYAFSIELLTRYSSQMVLLISIGMIYYHLKTINNRNKKRFMLICASLFVIGSSLIFINNYNSNGKLADQLYMTTLLPTAFRVSTDVPSTKFFDNAIALKEKADKAREEPLEIDETTIELVE
jgi:hypothetical protein